MNLRTPAIAALTLCCLDPLARADDAADAKAAAMALVKAITEHDTANIESHFTGTDPADVAAAKALSEVFVAQKSLNDSLEKKFGPEAVKSGGGISTPAQALERFSKAEVAVTGDKAVLKGPGGGRDDLTLTRVNGQWKVNSLFGNAAQRDQIVKIAPSLSSAFTDTAKDVDAGKLATMDAVKQAMLPRLMGAAMRNQGAAASKPSTQPAH